MKTLYKTSAVSSGGRDGQSFVEHTPIHFEMALPPEMGGSKPVGFNPEQFFAAGYASCFGSALQHVLKTMKLVLAPPMVHTTVSIGTDLEGGYSLAVDIVVVFKDTDQETAELLATEAHKVCPYSKATRGNIEVTVSAMVK